MRTVNAYTRHTSGATTHARLTCSATAEGFDCCRNASESAGITRNGTVFVVTLAANPLPPFFAQEPGRRPWRCVSYSTKSSAHRANRLDWAQEGYAAAIALLPQSVPALHNRGVVFSDQRDFAAAHRAFDDALRVDEHFASAWNGKGVVYQQEDRWADAAKMFRRALTENKHHERAWANLLDTLLQKGDWAEAVRESDAAGQAGLSPHIVDRCKGIGLKNLGQHAASAKCLARAIKGWDTSGPHRNHDIGWAYAHLADVYHKAGARTGSWAAAQSALASDRTNPLAAEVAGHLLRGHGAMASALVQYEHVLHNLPDGWAQTPRLMNIGICHTHLRQYSAAREAFTKVLDREPENVEAEIGLAHALVGEGEYALALPHLNALEQQGLRGADRERVTNALTKYNVLGPWEEKVPHVVYGEYWPTGRIEIYYLAYVCRQKGYHLTAARLYHDPLCTGLPRPPFYMHTPDVRFLAIEAAARSGLGLGRDAGLATAEERRRMRSWARQWMSDDLKELGSFAEKREHVQKVAIVLNWWFESEALRTLRGAEAIGDVSQEETRLFRELWTRAEVLRARIDDSSVR